MDRYRPVVKSAGRKAPNKTERGPAVFDDACIRKLAEIGKLSLTDAALAGFGESVRAAALAYVRDAAEPSPKKLIEELARLHQAADRKQCDLVGDLLQGLSKRARADLEERGAQFHRPIALPGRDELSDPERCEAACKRVLDQCEVAGRWVWGRNRPSGRRSRLLWQTILWAPEARQRPARREREREFAMWLQIAVAEASERPPAPSASATKPGPFVKMLSECLNLLGAGHVNAAELINSLARERRAASGNIQTEDVIKDILHKVRDVLG